MQKYEPLHGVIDTFRCKTLEAVLRTNLGTDFICLLLMRLVVAIYMLIHVIL